MKTYIVRNLDVDWDKLSSAIIVAESKEEAIEMFVAIANNVSPYSIKGYDEGDELEAEEMEFKNKGVVHTDWKMG